MLSEVDSTLGLGTSVGTVGPTSEFKVLPGSRRNYNCSSTLCRSIILVTWILTNGPISAQLQLPLLLFDPVLSTILVTGIPTKVLSWSRRNWSVVSLNSLPPDFLLGQPIWGTPITAPGGNGRSHYNSNTPRYASVHRATSLFD